MLLDVPQYTGSSPTRCHREQPTLNRQCRGDRPPWPGGGASILLAGHTRPPDLPECSPRGRCLQRPPVGHCPHSPARGSPCHLLLKCQVLAASAKLGTCICPQEGSCSDPEVWAQQGAGPAEQGYVGPGDGPCLWLRPWSPPSCLLPLSRSLDPSSAL